MTPEELAAAIEEIDRKLTSAAKLADAVHKLKRTSLLERVGGLALGGLVASLVLGAMQYAVETRKAAFAATEHRWKEQAEDRKRKLDYLDAVMHAASHGDRVFMLKVIASGEPGEASMNDWATRLRGHVDALAVADQSKMQELAQSTHSVRMRIQAKQSVRRAERDPKKKGTLDQEIQDEARKLSRDESELRSVQERVWGSGAKRRLCFVGGIAFPLSATDSAAQERECRGLAQTGCSTQVCDWRLE